MTDDSYAVTPRDLANLGKRVSLTIAALALGADALIFAPMLYQARVDVEVPKIALVEEFTPVCQQIKNISDPSAIDLTNEPMKSMFENRQNSDGCVAAGVDAHYKNAGMNVSLSKIFGFGFVGIAAVGLAFGDRFRRKEIELSGPS